ncbi:hypothetical protein PV327_008281 [Microctonus hyperodae]|uniref:ATP synthase subunit b n=1 Tax=Microctonus hyperodae TaxID=165561 RepID=A0AA39KH54_MICHY|nr:hypothetical protein PV327_008281 [Microctonus hyperodae]
MFSRIALRNVAGRLPALARVESTSSCVPSKDVEQRGRPINPAPVRYGFIPENWFQFFYNKTGYTGPYMFATGVATYLVSKEWYVLEHEFYTGIPVLLMSVIIVKKFGPATKKFIDAEMEKDEKACEDSRTFAINDYKEAIENEKKQQWRSEAQQMIIDAKKENIKMQLEAVYRDRVARVYNEVKKRLDFQLQIANVERRIAQKHMSQWIISNVLKAITPEQENAALQQCITELSALAPRA